MANTTSTNHVLQHCYSMLQLYPQIKRLLIAFSGGLDSSVLLHVIAKLQEKKNQFECLAIHINHALHPDADHWAKHCQSIAEHLEISCQVVPIHIPKHRKNKKGLEAAAREARYAALKQYMTVDTALLTAHHQTDQAETLLMHLFRGTGLSGLAAMPHKKSFAAGLQLRPFLALPAKTLRDYAQEFQLSWIEDPSNQDTTFSRNFTRHQLLPLIQTRWPQAPKQLYTLSQHMHEAESLIDEIASQDLQAVQKNAEQIKLEKLLTYTMIRQKNLIRYWLKSTVNITPEKKHLDILFNEVLHARIDASPILQLGDYQLRRYANTLYLVKAESYRPIPHFSIPWSLKDDLYIPEYHIQIPKALLNIVQSPKIAAVTVCNRKNGMQLRLHPNGKQQKVKHLLQNWGVPPWKRDKIIFLCKNGVLLMAADFFSGEKQVPEMFFSHHLTINIYEI